MNSDWDRCRAIKLIKGNVVLLNELIMNRIIYVPRVRQGMILINKRIEKNAFQYPGLLWLDFQSPKGVLSVKDDGFSTLLSTR